MPSHSSSSGHTPPPTINVRTRIGRHAMPGGIVVHLVAIPTGRLVDVHPLTSGVELRDTIELHDDEVDVVPLFYDGDSGRLIGPPRPPGLVERFLWHTLPPVQWAVLLLNAGLVALAIAHHRPAWVIVVNTVCTAIAIGCLHLTHRQRRRRTPDAKPERTNDE